MSDTISGTTSVPVPEASTSSDKLIDIGSTRNSRLTSKDYAAEIQRLELERLKLQTHPISLPVGRMMNTAIVPVVQKSSASSAENTNGSIQNGSKSELLYESQSTPDLRLNLDSIKTDMKHDQQIVHTIQEQLTHSSEELDSVRMELKHTDKREHTVKSPGLHTEDVSEEQRLIADLRKQLEQQAKENTALQQQVLSSGIKHQSPVTMVTSSSTAQTNSKSSYVKTSSYNTNTGHTQLATSPNPPNLLSRNTNAHTAETEEASSSSSHSPGSQGGTLHSISANSSFTSVTGMSASLASEARERKSRETRVKGASLQPPANLEGQRRSPERCNEIHLERRLEQSQTQITQLKDRLKECNDICEQQKIHFRDSIAELQAKLKDTIVGRNSVLDLRKKEAEGQEHLIDQLQKTLKELESDYSQLQEASKASGLKIDSLQQSLSNSTAALNQINHTVTEEASNRGLTLLTASSSLEESSSANQRPGLVVTSFQQLWRHCEEEVNDLRLKVMHCGKELEELKKEHSEYKLKVSEEYRSKLNQLSEEHEKQMNTVTERAMNARQQATGLQAQLSVLQEQTHVQMEAKSKHVSELEQTIAEMQQQFNETKRVLEEKCQSLNNELDELTDHHQTVSKERDDLVNIVEGLEQELADAKDLLARADTTVDAEHQQFEQLQTTLENTTQKYNDLESQLKQKTSEVEELKRSLEETKEVARKQMEEKISTVESNERQRSSELATQLSTQVATLTHKCTILSQELDQREAILSDFKRHQDDTTKSTEDKNYQLQMALSNKVELAKLLEERKRAAEVLQQERDHYFVLLEERNKEVDLLRSEQENLLAEVRERDQQVTAFKEQTSNMTHLVELSSKSSHDMKDEKARLQTLLEERRVEANSLKIAMEGVEGKLKLKERKVEELEEVNQRLEEEVSNKMQGMEEVIRSKEKMLTQLREAKLEIDAMAKDNERLRLDLVHGRRQFDKDRHKLTSKLRAVQHELSVTTKAVQTANTVDIKAVRVAESMQKKVTAKRGEIDSLQSKMHWLEESLDAALKERAVVNSEKDRLTLKVDKLSQQNQRLTTDLTIMVQKRKAQKSIVRKLESALEKAALKHSEVQAYIEMQEQDIARLRLRHQLEIKELQRSAIPNTNRPTPISTHTRKAYYPVPASAMIPPSLSVTRETKAQAVQTNSTSLPEQYMLIEQAAKKGVVKPETPQLLPHSEVNLELKELLSEMKTVLNTAVDAAKQSKQTPPLSTQSKGLDPPIHTSSPMNPTLTSHVQSTSYASYLQGPLTAYTPTKLTMDGPPSPVANLLGRYRNMSASGQDSMDRKDTQVNGVKVAAAVQSRKTRHRRVSSGKDVDSITEVASEEDVTSVTSVTTPDLDSSMEAQKHHIEQLEEQLKVLSKIGGQLQQENQEMATLIKTQDTKLKKCRREEKAITSLVSTTKH